MKKWMYALVLVVAGALVTLLLLQFEGNTDGFEKVAFPLDRIDRFFDVGIVDADDDGDLDIYTSNHHFRQVLLLSDNKGGYRDVLSEWGLDQSLEFPMAELSFTAPEADKPGLYLYWLGTQFIIKAHNIEGLGRIKGTLEVNDPIKIMKNEGFKVTNTPSHLPNDVTHTVLSFETDHDAFLRIRPAGQGLPLEFRFEKTVRPDQIFVGLGKVSPTTLSFALAMRDRHALVWADYNGDGQKDIFINRGALGGRLRAQPDDIRRRLQDELLVRQANGKFKDIASQVGLEKRDCSGRHARWIDFNGDGLLDLYVNCFDRRHTFGKFPKQYYEQQKDGSFVEKAEEVDLGIPDQQIGSLAWFDVDDDGDIDLVTMQNKGFFLYRNDNGKVAREIIYERPILDVKIGSSTEGAWVYDGKISLGDYDRDGDIDLFSSSKRGNVLLVNEGGRLHYVDPTTVGLPASSFNASWVDYDNDGYPDLHTVPQGLFHQEENHQFQATDTFRFPHEQYQGAVSNWFDMDNDGYLDLMLTLNASSDYDPWWRSVRKPRVKTTWLVDVFRNLGTSNHWLQLRLKGKRGNPEAIGARVTVVTEDGRQTQEVGASEGAFFSQGHYRLYFGLGKNSMAKRIEIRWPDGAKKTLENVSADQLLTIAQKND